MSRPESVAYCAALIATLALTGHAMAFIGWVLAIFVMLVCVALLGAVAVIWLRLMLFSLLGITVAGKGVKWLHRG